MEREKLNGKWKKVECEEEKCRLRLTVTFTCLNTPSCLQCNNCVVCLGCWRSCIKPNADKSADSFNAQLVLQQLRYTGVLETVKIRKEGYPTRLTFVHFMQRSKEAYCSLLHATINTESFFSIFLLFTLFHRRYYIGSNRSTLQTAVSNFRFSTYWFILLISLSFLYLCQILTDFQNSFISTYCGQLTIR